MKKYLMVVALFAVSPLFAHWINTTGGEGDNVDKNKYACALISKTLGEGDKEKANGIFSFIVYNRYVIPFFTFSWEKFRRFFIESSKTVCAFRCSRA